MSSVVFAERPALRWLVPGVVAAVIGGGAAVASRPASAEAGLPDRSAAELIADVERSGVTSLSGTVVQSADLGLPQLMTTKRASGDLSSAEGLTALGAGSHTWRIWTAGPTKSRLALVSELGESDVIRNGQDLWLWSSRDKQATHYTLPAEAGHGAKAAPGSMTGAHPKPSGLPTPMPTSPDEAAKLALAKLDPSTEVSTAGTAMVAGRPAYELVLTPRDRESLVSSVRIAVDGERRVPLRVQVFGSTSAGAGKAAIDVGFTAVDFSAPDARQFEFAPPPDTTVTQGSTEHATQAPAAAQMSAEQRAALAAAATPRTVGSGWTTVVVGALPRPDAANQAPARDQATGQLEGMLATLPETSGTWGSGRLLQTNLLTAVVTTDGRYAVGAVAPQKLYEALSSR